MNIDKLKQVLNSCDAVVIGAGAGLSASAGLLYSGERFEKNFPDFIEKYGLTDMYSSAFYPFKTPEELWAYWSRHIFLNRYQEEKNEVYTDLFNIVKNKEYFVITTNADHLFIKNGFDKQRLFYTQGDYGLWQCSTPCHEKTYDNKNTVLEMVKRQRDMKIPSDLIPYCPKCNKPMMMNLRIDVRFVEEDGWHKALKRYQTFINKHKKILYLELGIGDNTPSIIKYPFWQMTHKNKDSFYVCMNLNYAYIPEEIEKRSICFTADIAQTLKLLLN